jgi:hypothetical protein
MLVRRAVLGRRSCLQVELVFRRNGGKLRGIVRVEADPTKSRHFIAQGWTKVVAARTERVVAQVASAGSQ